MIRQSPWLPVSSRWRLSHTSWADIDSCHGGALDVMRLKLTMIGAFAAHLIVLRAVDHPRVGRPTPGRGRLSAHDRIVFDTLLPAGSNPTLPDGVLTAGLPGTIAEFHSAADARMRSSLRLALLAATWISPLTDPQGPPDQSS